MRCSMYEDLSYDEGYDSMGNWYDGKYEEACHCCEGGVYYELEGEYMSLRYIPKECIMKLEQIVWE